MKSPDLDRLRSEKKIPIGNFLASYNENLPAAFPRASLSLLREYKNAYPTQFKEDDLWSLDQHRKRVMDWLTVRTRPSLTS